jgi:hypothetical protein
MTSAAISTEDVSYRKHVQVAGTQMAYVEVGAAMARFVATVLAGQIA